MKFLILLLITVLLAGCGTSVPPENTPETLRSEPSAEEIPPLTLDEPADIPESEPETQAEAEEPYSGDIFYFTKLPAAPAMDEPEDETVIPSPEPEDTYRALAAVVFDKSLYTSWDENNYSNTILSYTDNPPRFGSIQYPRMTTDGIVYPADKTEFSSPTGYTADKIPYVWETREYVHPESSEAGTEYSVSFLLDETSMITLSFYSYTYDENYETAFLRPLLDTCRTWIPETPLTYRFTGQLSEEESAPLTVDIPFSDRWCWNNSSVADDMERMYTGRYSTKRMEFYPELMDTPHTGFYNLTTKGVAVPVTGNTKDGLPYEMYVYDSFSEGEPLGCTWYFVNIVYNDLYLPVTFLAFEDDPADYFDTVILPVIESVHIVPTE